MISNRISTLISHQVLGAYYHRRQRRFGRSLDQLESMQRDKLKQIVESLQATQKWNYLSKDLSYEDIRSMVPIRTYADYRDDVEKQRETQEPVLCHTVQRYEPTSGSTDKRKWIPYSKQFLEEINSAASVWLGDLYLRYPEIKKGRHYWSLSWLPEELRSFTNSDDSDLFPFYQRFLIQNTMAVSNKIAKLPTSEQAWWATLVSLCGCEDLSFASVWSPTFLLKIVEDIQTYWPEIKVALRDGRWLKHETEISKSLGSAPLRDLDALDINSPDFLKRLWPNLALVSVWDSSSSAYWFEILKNKFSGVSFQGKGLWATEGVISFPFQNEKVLAMNSHFYEFLDIESGNVVPSWQVKIDRDYQPILWSSTGLLRYLVPDRIRVTGFLKHTPCLEFVGRVRSVDLVGEKMDAAWVQSLFSENAHWNARCLIACRFPKPHYILVHQSNENIDIEKELLGLHHYQVAREIGQLGQARLLSPAEPLKFLTQFGQSQLHGQNKLEVLFEIDRL